MHVSVDCANLYVVIPGRPEGPGLLQVGFSRLGHTSADLGQARDRCAPRTDGGWFARHDLIRRPLA